MVVRAAVRTRVLNMSLFKVILTLTHLFDSVLLIPVAPDRCPQHICFRGDWLVLLFIIYYV